MQERTSTPAASATSAASATPATSHPVTGTPARSPAHGQWLLVAGGLLLGTLGVFVEEAGQHPLVTVLLRCVFGALALLAWGLATGRARELRLQGRRSVAVVLATGVLMVLNWGLFFAAIPRTSIGVATIAFHIQPVWVMLYGVLVLREPVSPLRQAATVGALLGLALATGLWSGAGQGAVATGWGPGYALGLLMCLGGSFSYAGVTIIAQAGQRISPFALAWWQCAIGALLLCWVPMVHGWPRGAEAWAWLAGLGVLHTGLAYAIVFAGMARLTLGRIAVLQYVYPLTAIVLDWAVYGRALDAVQLAGVGLMAMALLAVKAR